MLSFDETDLLAFFESGHESGENDTWLRWSAQREGLILSLALWPCDGHVMLSLRREGSECDLLDFGALDCEEVRYVPQQREYLEVIRRCAETSAGARSRSCARVFLRPDFHVELKHD